MNKQPYSPGLEGIISNTTKLSFLDVDQEQILIRGYDLIELAKHLHYTDVAFLIINGEMPNLDQSTRFQSVLKDQYGFPEDLYQIFRLMPKTTSVMDAMRSAISLLAGYENPDSLTDNSHKANLRKGIKLLATLPSVAANAYRSVNGLPLVKPDPNLGYSENFLYMIRDEIPDDVSLESFDRILTCYSEHELANSTFTARVIGSTLSDMYGAMTGAIASLKGPLHGGANEAAINMLLEILSQGGVTKTETHLMDKLANKERIMGFGHRVYMKKYDPRAYFLKDYLPLLATRKPEGKDLYDIYLKVEEVMLRERGLYPNADYPIALLFYLLDIPVVLDTPIFFSARVAGLVAHVMEQHEDNRLFRPRVQYEGPRGLVPLSLDYNTNRF